MPLADFYIDYMKNRLEPGEFVQAIEVPLPRAGAEVRAYKISQALRLRHLGASAPASRSSSTATRCATLRLAFGGMAATVKRAAAGRGRAASASRGPRRRCAPRRRRWRATSRRSTDMRASADYRLQVAQNLLRRFWLETRPHAPLARERDQRLERDAACRAAAPRAEPTP